MKLFKVTGWLLLIVGIVIIGWTLISSYNIFTAFNIEEETSLTPAKQIIPTTPAQIQEEVERMIGEQLKEILPAGAISEILNLMVWSMLAFILIFGGAQISVLGIKIIKK